ncbi:MAG: aminopeptidase [Oscillospiraceae bacterium]|nr:aminopeptidase [Oscillospiraceae bacterium]
MANTEKTAGELLQERLLMHPENGGIILSDEELEKAFAFCEGYKKFLDEAKTEREAVDLVVAMAEKAGYVPFDPKADYKAGDKVYLNNRGKALLMCTFGTEPISKGVRIVVSHLDNPRLDLKPNPLYEEAQLGYLKTHYYGGIKKYQWGAIPLALHGVIVKKNGETVRVSIGEDENDPIFCVTDLLPHLAREQMKRTLNEGLRGEELNVLIGCHPFRDDKASEKVKLNLIRLLNEKYGIVEADFLSAELCVVPAFKARDLGLDRAMIGAYGHDDRVCAYTSLMAELEQKTPSHTTVLALADKEETGSEGNTGLDSRYLEDFVKDLAAMQGETGRAVLAASTCLSADVNAAYDPTFGDVCERRNTSYLNYGVVITKYTGSGGKYGTSDATAEYMASVRRLLDEGGVVWQTGELGKVDAGGGGTVAKYIAKLNVDVVDVGVPVLSMHAPLEVVSKVDVYMTYRAFSEFIK